MMSHRGKRKGKPGEKLQTSAWAGGGGGWGVGGGHRETGQSSSREPSEAEDSRATPLEL